MVRNDTTYLRYVHETFEDTVSMLCTIGQQYEQYAKLQLWS